jgi:murein DD-endopeptidase
LARDPAILTMRGGLGQHRAMRKPMLAGAIALLLPFCASAQTQSGFPVDIAIPIGPSPVKADGKTRLLYELRITNFYDGAIDLAQIDVIGDDPAAPIASYRGEALEKLLMSIGSASGSGKAATFAGGGSAVAFLDLSLDPGAPLPKTLRHRLTFTITPQPGTVIERTLNGPSTEIGAAAPVMR